jgi:hypothetical protein
VLATFDLNPLTGELMRGVVFQSLFHRVILDEVNEAESAEFRGILTEIVLEIRRHNWSKLFEVFANFFFSDMVGKTPHIDLSGHENRAVLLDGLNWTSISVSASTRSHPNNAFVLYGLLDFNCSALNCMDLSENIPSYLRRVKRYEAEPPRNPELITHHSRETDVSELAEVRGQNTLIDIARYTTDKYLTGFILAISRCHGSVRNLSFG